MDSVSENEDELVGDGEPVVSGSVVDDELDGIVENDEENQLVENGEVLAEQPKKPKKLQHICLTLWDTDEAHRDELKEMYKRYEWHGYIEGKERAPDTGRLHLHVYVQTHHTRRKRIT
jgi:hypothetical protein